MSTGRGGAGEQMRWIVVGAGSIGQRHLTNLLQMGYSDVAAVRRSGSALNGELGSVPVHRTIEEARGTGITIALICTPTSLHLTDALTAARLGCHVLIEKPLSDRMDGVGELADTIGRAGTRAGVAHSLRFHPVIRSVRDRLASGALGLIAHVAVWAGQHLADWRPTQKHQSSYSAVPEMGGGVVLDLIHEIDYLHWMFGNARSVMARLREWPPLGIRSEAIADLVIEFRNGIQATCHLDYVSRPPIRGGVVTGDLGSLRWDLAEATIATWGSAKAWSVEHRATEWRSDRMYIDELRAFAEHVTRGGPWASNLDDAARTLRTALAAKQSDKTGSALVLLPEGTVEVPG